MKQTIIQWCQIFGSFNEDVHWSKLKGEQVLIADFDREMILKVSGLSLEEWNSYHKNLKRLRDKFFAHFDIDSTEDYLPKLDSALVIADSYRDWLYDLLSTANELGQLMEVGFVKSQEFRNKIENEFIP